MHVRVTGDKDGCAWSGRTGEGQACPGALEGRLRLTLPTGQGGWGRDGGEDSKEGEEAKVPGGVSEWGG